MSGYLCSSVLLPVVFPFFVVPSYKNKGNKNTVEEYPSFDSKRITI